MIGEIVSQHHNGTSCNPRDFLNFLWTFVCSGSMFLTVMSSSTFVMLAEFLLTWDVRCQLFGKRSQLHQFVLTSDQVHS